MMEGYTTATMDWLSGIVESEDYIVVTDEDLLDMFQSPDSWLPWGVSESESLSTYYTSIEKNNQEMVFEEEQGKVSIQESEQSISSTIIPDLQFNDHHMDDSFWGSVLGPDMLETGNNNNKSMHLSSEPQFGLIPAVGGGITDSIVDLQTAVHKGTSIGIIDNPVEKVFQCSFYGYGQHYENNGSDWFNGGQIIPEEHLFELGMAMKRLPESTRLCFRDYFYRCSYNSTQHSHLLQEPSQMQADDEKIRSSSEQIWIATSGTDIVDKVVATFLCS